MAIASFKSVKIYGTVRLAPPQVEVQAEIGRPAVAFVQANDKDFEKR